MFLAPRLLASRVWGFEKLRGSGFKTFGFLLTGCFNVQGFRASGFGNSGFKNFWV